MGIFSFAFFAFISLYKKSGQALKTNIFYFLFPLFFILPSLVGERLWFQGNRMYEPLFGFVIMFFSFLSPYIESQNPDKKISKQITLAIVVAILILSSTISFVKMNGFNGALPFWDRIIAQSRYQNITAHKFHAYALMEDAKPQQAANELLTVCRSLNFTYDETNYGLGQAFMLSGQFENAAKIYELMLSNSQMVIPQTYASLILAYLYLDDQKKADFWINEFRNKFNVSPQATNQYLNEFNNYLRSIGR
jgi:tetratricopeptide (TPR) repeat protein